LSGGATVRGYIDELRRTVAAVQATNDPAFGATGTRLGEAVEHLDRTTMWLLGRLDSAPQAALAGATPYLRLFGLAAGGCMLAQDALAATRAGLMNAAPLVATARFFASQLVTATGGLACNIIDGVDAFDTLDPTTFE
jgi:acyl-CoA dehydrogenase